MEVLGIDIGGSGIKGAPVETQTGEQLQDRHRIPTPKPATPHMVLDVISEIITYFDWKGPIGVGYPGVIKRGRVHTAANVDNSWIGFDLKQSVERLTSSSAEVINDADAAAVAEIMFGAGRGQAGTLAMVTLGTGIGVSVFVDGKLVPNLELGHIEIRGKDAEKRASDAARERKDWSWKKWAKRVDEYLYRLEHLIWPDLYILGGGVSKKWDKFVPYFKKQQVKIVPAEMRNNAGIVGAAMVASDDFNL